MNIDNTNEASFLVLQSLVSNKSSYGGLPNHLTHEIEKKKKKKKKQKKKKKKKKKKNLNTT